MRPLVLPYLSMRGILQDITLDIVEVESLGWGSRHCNKVVIWTQAEYPIHSYTFLSIA